MAIMSDSVFSGPDEQRRKIDEAEVRCRQLENETNVTEPGWCPLVWDGLACWNSTSAGQVAVQSCPSYIAGFDQEANATKRCMSNSTWFVNAENKTWTNYSLCYNSSMATVVMSFPDTGNSTLYENALPVVKTMSQVGYAVSLISLLVASAVLATIKKLRCPRNMLHLHLFASFIMRAFFSLLKSLLFVDGIGLRSDLIQDGSSILFVARQENWVCKMIISLWQYFIMANYSWILMEGLYLHNLIFLALFSDTSSISLYVVLGWGLPTAFVAAWVVARLHMEDSLCWTTNVNSYIFLVIRIPTILSVLLSFALFVNIIRMLMKKLQASICDETRRHRYRRWAKSTLVLVPLFGAHYALLLGMSYGVHTGQSSADSEMVETVWLFLDQAFASFQGFFVAVLYCFMNGEVRAELNKAWSESTPWWRRRPGFWFKTGQPRHPSLHSYDTTCSSYGAPWAIRKRSEGRNTVTSMTACEAGLASHGRPTPEEVPLSTSVKDRPSACSRL